MSSHPQTTTHTRPNRLPAPALFIGPPSRNTSHLSLARPAPRPPSPPQTPRQHIPHSSSSTGASAAPPPAAAAPSRASLDASFSTLQRALDEVEAAAATRTTGVGVCVGATAVFGAEHAAALRGLRGAQVRLAEAWGPTGREEEGDASAAAEEGRREHREKEGERTTRDGESELRSAAERRERNEVYFAGVKRGMLDVVGKLDEIAQAMKRVETEGREIWDDASVEERREVRNVS